jgi:DNA processing protein
MRYTAAGMMLEQQTASRRLQAVYLLAVARNFEPRHSDLIALQLGSLEALFDAPEEELRQLPLTGGALHRLLDARTGCDAEGELAQLATQGIAFLGWGEPHYPRLLAGCADAPLGLFARGDLSLLDHDGIAIVGSRKCSETGRRLARDFGRDIAELGLPVVSGLALGIDGAAHEGALEVRGPTIAVLGCGVDVCYPPQHHELYARLVAGGLIVSEYGPGTEPRREHFPQRNRIISGLARGTLVVEAPLGSGALITAQTALEQGRDVFALPGPVGSPLTKGTHHLIKHGQAKLVEDVDDILAEYGTNKAVLRKQRYTAAGLLGESDPSAVRGPQPAAAVDGAADKADSGLPAPDAQPQDTLSKAERRILEGLSYEGTHVNELVRRMGISTAECIAHLTLLEIRGLISAASGGYYVRL